MIRCKVCKRDYGNEGVRLGVCWNCATAESIIAEGLDMYDKGPNTGNQPAKTPMEKLTFLIESGWCWDMSQVIRNTADVESISATNDQNRE